MSNRTVKNISFLMILSIFCSCKTYTISPQNLKEQFFNSDSLMLRYVKTSVGGLYTMMGTASYRANDLDNIVVLDKKGQQKIITNSPAIEMRVTLNNNKKYILYFDTIVVENDTLTGSQSRFIPSLTKKIPFGDIQKIEIQDGGKDIKYID